MIRGLRRILGAAAVYGLLASSALAGDLVLHDLNGHVVRLSGTGGPVVVAFWQSNCAPCVIELRAARDYAAAARPGRFLFVGLQDASALRAAVDKSKAPLDMVVRAEGEPSTILTSFGGAPPRLPLAVVFDAAGHVCARHSGLLGSDQVRAWVQACGSAHARG
jgi:thiol-disulfide isomerase/thioredoxin